MQLSWYEKQVLRGLVILILLVMWGHQEVGFGKIYEALGLASPKVWIDETLAGLKRF